MRSTLLHPQQVSERNAVIVFNVVRIVAALALIVVVALALL